MPRHWLDSNVFIEPKNGSYAFDIVPGFWSWLERQAKLGVVASPMAVFKELVHLEGRADDLAKWAQKVKDVMFVDPDERVQTKVREIADHVTATYGEPYASDFMRGADAWIVAQAAIDQGVVVTIEVARNTKKIKIPNVCGRLNVGCCNHLKMLRNLGASFVEEGER